MTIEGWNAKGGVLGKKTLRIFLQGMNLIIRMMMAFPNAMNKTTGVWNLVSTLATIIGLLLSLYLIIRLDQPDVRTMRVN